MIKGIKYGKIYSNSNKLLIQAVIIHNFIIKLYSMDTKKVLVWQRLQEGVYPRRRNRQPMAI